MAVSKAGSRPVSALRARAEEYLAMRRALGFRLTTQGRHLMSFVAFCEDRGADHVTTDLAIEWATQTTRGSSDAVYQARRLDVARIVARHLQALDPATEVPPDDVLSRRYRRIPPYLYPPQEITALMNAADGLEPPLRATTWRTLIGLLAVTGMRQGEACRLHRDDVDLRDGTLVIRDSKFGKSRQVFLHPTAVTALRAYQRARDRTFPRPQADTFLVNSRGGPLDGHNIQSTFAVLIAAAGIAAPPGRRAPRLHDLRHTFTVATLLGWYRDDGNVQARLPLLSTWLGHIDPKSTYWYLQAVPELLALAAGKLEQAGGCLDGRVAP
jgi:integrase